MVATPWPWIDAGFQFLAMAVLSGVYAKHRREDALS